MNKKMFCVLLLFVFSQVYSANILAVIPSGYYSHQATWWPLWRTLSDRGHHVFLMSPDKINDYPNITQIDTSITYKYFPKEGTKKILLGKFSFKELVSQFITDKVFSTLMDVYLNNTQLKRIEQKGIKFDLLIGEQLMIGISGLSYKYNCPFISAIVFDALPPNHYMAGNPTHSSIYPFAHISYEKQLTLLNRIYSFFSTSLILGLCYIFSLFLDGLLKKHLGNECPSLYDLENNASLIFFNANPFFYPNRPLSPISINLEGAMHITKPKQLPLGLQTYLDNATKGCVYVNFGSIVNSDDLDKNEVEHILSVFQKLDPVKVLWKFENTSWLTNMPSNIKFVKWVPQQDILAHKNVKVFISHGGLQSSEEALYFGVPVLGIPFFGDQYQNINRIVEQKVGLKVLKDQILSDTFENNLMELLNNPVYQQTMTYMSNRSKDKPMTGVEKAVWWIEYLLKYKTTDHLKSPSATIPLYQYYYLDVLGTLGIILFIFIRITKLSFKLLKSISKKIFKSKQKTN